jgi:hypothetical protein
VFAVSLYSQEVSIAAPVTVSYTKAVTTVYGRRRENYAEGMERIVKEGMPILKFTPYPEGDVVQHAASH